MCDEKKDELLSSPSDTEEKTSSGDSSCENSKNDDVVVFPSVEEEKTDESAITSEIADSTDVLKETEKPKDNQAQLLESIQKQLETIDSSEQKIFSEIREIHKLYHNEFAGRLTSMQDELEYYRKIDKGRIYDDILGAIARIYNNNESLTQEIQDPRSQKAVRYLLLDLEDILDEYGMSRIKSNPGDKRDPRHCQIHDRIITQNPNLHDTVARSYNTGFHIGNRTVIKEKVDIYFYDGKINQSKQEITTEKAVDDMVGN